MIYLVLCFYSLKTKRTYKKSEIVAAQISTVFRYHFRGFTKMIHIFREMSYFDSFIFSC